MRIEELGVRNFRNLKEQVVRFEERVTLIVGANGQGKTSLLEAIFFLAHAKSFRTSHQSELIRWRLHDEGAVTAIVRGKITASNGDLEIACEIHTRTKKALINGKVVEQATLFYGQFVAVVFTPDELQLVKGAALVRRKFIDRLLVMSDSRYVATAVQYQRALKQRNAQLQAMRNDSSINENALHSWNVLLAKYGTVLATTRAELVRALKPLTLKYYQELVGEGGEGAAAESVDLGYVSNISNSEGGFSEQYCLELLRSSAQTDVRRASTALGPHRDDLELGLDVGSGIHPARYTASQGQARSIALALVLAAVQHLTNVLGEPPAVLLDDVESEFDSARKSALHRILSRLKSQVIITATEPSLELLQHSAKVQILKLAQGDATQEKA